MRDLYPGVDQPAIVDKALFDAVQAKLDEQVSNHNTTRTHSEALLSGRIFDDRGHRMTPTHARKGNLKYRYYLSCALLQGTPERAGSVRRVPAAEIEALVARALRDHLKPSEPIEDRDLVDAHLVRVEVRSDQVIIQLAEAQETQQNCKNPRTDRNPHRRSKWLSFSPY